MASPVFWLEVVLGIILPFVGYATYRVLAAGSPVLSTRRAVAAGVGDPQATQRSDGPIAVAHGEGFAEFASVEDARKCSDSGLVSARFVDNKHNVTEQYPLNPNGSPLGLT